jgi:hypothetical protein
VIGHWLIRSRACLSGANSERSTLGEKRSKMQKEMVADLIRRLGIIVSDVECCDMYEKCTRKVGQAAR